MPDLSILKSPAAQAVFSNIVLPEILAWIRRRQHVDGEMPTDEQVIAHFRGNVDLFVGAGQAWLDAHPITEE